MVNLDGHITVDFAQVAVAIGAMADGVVTLAEKDLYFTSNSYI